MRNGDFFKRSASQKQESYIVEDLILENRSVIWASPPGEGKSLTAEALLYHIAYEAPYLGLKVVTGNVMFIDSENRYDILKWRCDRIKRGLENDSYKKRGEVDFQHYSGFLLDNKATWIAIEKEIKALEPSLIMLDHLAMFHSQDENKVKPMNLVSKAIEELMGIRNSSVLTMHHFNKNDKGTFIQRLRGSVAIYAKCDTACEVRALSRKEGKLEKVGLIPQPRKDVTPSPIRLRLEEGDDWLRLVHDGIYQPIEDVSSDRIYHDIFHIFLKFKDEKSVNDIKGILAGYASDMEIRESLRGLEDKGLLTKKIAGSGKYIYRLNVKKCPWCVYSSLKMKNG